MSKNATDCIERKEYILFCRVIDRCILEHTIFVFSTQIYN